MKSIFLVLGLFATLALASYQDKDKHYGYHDKNVKSYDPYYNPWVPAKYYDHKDYYDEKEKHYRRSKRSPVPTDDGKKDDYDDNKVKYDPYYNPNLKYYDPYYNPWVPAKYYDPYYNPWVPAKYYDHEDDYDEKEKHYRRSKRSPVPTDDGKKDDYDDKVKYDPYYNPNLKSYDPYYNPWVPAKYYDHKDDNDDKKGKFYKRFNRSKRSKRSPVPT